MRSWPFPYLAGVIGLAGLYFGAAKLGLSMGTLAEQVTLVWPPTGISLAVLLLFGYRWWPGIALGAFLANATVHEPPLVACGIAIGNTLEALLGAWLLRRLAGFRIPPERLRDVLSLIFLAAGLTTTVSATLGVASLCLGAVQPWSSYADLWQDWWLGDAIGALVVAPALLTWATRYHVLCQPLRITEGVLLLAGLGLVCAFVFSLGDAPNRSGYPLEYAVFPFVVWAALRFGQLGSTTVTFVTLGVAVWGTLGGLGPFRKATTHESLIWLQIYMAVLAVTGLLLGAAIMERDLTTRRRTTSYLATKALAEAATLPHAVDGILRALGESLAWDVGVLWIVDEPHQVLHCSEVWFRAGIKAPEFETASRQRTFVRGVGLPGRVWANGQPAWVEDVTTDTNFPRAPIAVKEQLHGAVGFPILAGGSVLGVIEFFSRQVRQPDADLLKLLVAIGSQVGLFLEHSRTHESLRQSHNILQAVTEGTTDAVYVKDLQSRYLMINSAGAQLLGKTVEEVLGRNDSELFTPDTGQAIMERDRLILTAGQTQTCEEVGTAAGVTRTYLSTKGPYRDPQGHIIGLIGISRDITNRKATEEALKVADRRKDEFLAMLAHELRNPLAPLRNALQILKRSPAAASLVQQMRDLMERQVESLVRMVDDLLDTSRIMRGRIELRKEAVALATVIERAIETARPSLEIRKQELQVTLPPEPVYLLGDPIRLAQVFANLLNNAAKYTDKGGRISLSAERAHNEVIVRVRDNGIGIAPELLSRIFDLFVQGNHLLDRAQGGLGIGLTLVKALVERHGGEVTASSPGPGQGSEFTVRLPCSATTAEPATPPSRAASLQAAQRRRILVVDDNVDVAESLVLLLRLEGHDVRVAYSGPAALAAAQCDPPEIALVDIGMPTMDGHEVARRFRQEPALAQVALIALTGWGKDEDRERTRAAGFDHHLVKPVDPHLLRELLAQGKWLRASQSLV